MNPSRQIKNPVADLLDASSDAKSFLRAANNAAMRESLEVSIGVSGYLLTQQSATSGGLWGPMDGSVIMFLGDTAYLMGGWYGDIANDDWSGGSTTNLVYRSTDFGVTWTKIRDHDLTPDATHFTPRHAFAHCVHRVGATDYMYMFCGDYQLADSDVRRSTDGVTWTKVNSVQPGYHGIQLAAAGTLDGNIYFAGGTVALETASHTNEVWRSSDNGATWASLGNAPWAIRSGVDRLVRFAGKLWLIGGGIYDDTLGRTYYNDVWSFDGTTWTEVLANGHTQWTGRMFAGSVALGEWLYVIRGYNDSGMLSDTYRSRDGGTWFLVNITLEASHGDAIGEHVSGVLIGPGIGFLTNNINANSPTYLLEPTGSGDIASGVAAMIEATLPAPINEFETIIVGSFVISESSGQWMVGEDGSGFYICSGALSVAKPVYIGSPATTITTIYGASIQAQGPIQLVNYSIFGRSSKELFAISDNPAVRATWHAVAFRPYSFQYTTFCEYSWDENTVDAHLWNSYEGDNTYGGWRWLSGSGKTLRLHLHGDGQLDLGAPLKLKSYTVGTLPIASISGDGGSIYVTDESGGEVPAFSDGTNWRRVTDRAIVS